MKRTFVGGICLIVLTLSLAACSADEVNGAIEGAAGKVGVEVDSKITQEQIDGAVDKAKKSADAVKDIVTDEEVQGAAKNLIDSVSNATKDKKEN